MIRLTVFASNFTMLQDKFSTIPLFVDKSMTLELETLARKLMGSVVGEITVEDFVWTGRLRQSVGMRRRSNREMEIVQNETPGVYILYGTTPRPDAVAPPKGLVEWAESKLGLDSQSAWPAALTIFRNGLLGRTRPKWEPGDRGYNYADYIVNVKNADDIRDTASKVPALVVGYVASWQIPFGEIK